MFGSIVSDYIWNISEMGLLEEIYPIDVMCHINIAILQLGQRKVQGKGNYSTSTYIFLRHSYFIVLCQQLGIYIFFVLCVQGKGTN